MNCICTRRLLSVIVFFWGLHSAIQLSWAQSGGDPSAFEIRRFQHVAPGEAQLTLSTPSNHTYSVLVTTNLLEWQPAGPFPPVSFDGDTATYLVEVNPEWSQAAFRVAYEPQKPDPDPLPFLDAPGTDPVTEHCRTWGYRSKMKRRQG